MIAQPLRKYPNRASKNPYLIGLNSLIPRKTGLRRPQARPLQILHSGGVGLALT